MAPVGKSIPDAPRLTIVGLGLIGTSLGLAWKRSGSYHIVGHDKDSKNASIAKKLGAVDETHWNLISAVEHSDVVVIATPVRTVECVLRDIGHELKPGAVVTDTAGTKSDVMRWASEHLPDGISFVGGHPMAGKETSGPSGAEATLFEGCSYCIVPAERCEAASVDAIISLAAKAGSRPFFLSAEEHDSYVAGVSHLPFLLSVALVRTTTRSSGWRDLARLASSGYRDVGRLASGDPDMHRDVCATNREAIVAWIERLKNELDSIAQLVREDENGLTEALSQAKAARDEWIRERYPTRTSG